MIDFENGIIIAGGFRIDKNTKSHNIKQYFKKRVIILPNELDGMIIGYEHYFRNFPKVDENWGIIRIECNISEIQIWIESSLSEMATIAEINRMLENVPTRKPRLLHEYKAHWICDGCCISQHTFSDGKPYIRITIPAQDMTYLKPTYSDLTPKLQGTIRTLLHEDQSPE